MTSHVPVNGKRRMSVAAALLAACIAGSAAPAAFANDSVTLRVNDIRAEPGGLAAVEVRTYAPRGMEQGEICVVAGGSGKATGLGALLGPKVPAKTAKRPFAALEAVAVFSATGDATSAVVFDADRQMALLRFSSPSATINESDGPLAIFYFRVREDVSDRDIFFVEIDPAGTYLLDADGEKVAIEPKEGRLEIRTE